MRSKHFIAGNSFFILIILFCLQITVFSQENWTEIRRGGSGDLVSVYFTSSEKGWVGGDDGYLAMTRDGGRNWNRQPLNSTENVNEIYFRNDDNGYVLAGRRIYLSKDGGETWRENILINRKDYNGLTPDFLSIRFADKKRGWIVGSLTNQKDEVADSLILKTVDAGENWVRIVVPFKQELYHLDFVSDSTGWIVGDKGLILMTEDGGETWRKLASGTNTNLYNVDFRDKKNGLIVGGKGTILRTEDGGQTWEKVSSNQTKSLLRVNYADDKRAWAVGTSGDILQTEDRGKTWNQISRRSVADSLYGLYVEKKTGWAVGKKGLVLRYAK